MTVQVNGIGVSRGIALGQATIIPRGQITVSQYDIPQQDIKQEVHRFQKAVNLARRQLHDIQQQIPDNLPADISSFIDSHLLMMEDPSLTHIPVDIIRKEHCNAEWALKQQYEMLIQAFEEIDDPYLKTRRDDIGHVVSRIQRILMNEASLSDMVGDGDLSKRIIIADDLSPADTVLMQQKNIAGFITEFGGPLSHAAILARSLRIPAIVGMRHAQRLFQADEEIIIDGDEGVAIAAPNRRITLWYQQRQKEDRRKQRNLTALRAKRSVTLDGIAINLEANIELPEDIRAAKRSGCSGIGLYRTEYLYMNREDYPSEEEQYRAYRHIVRAMKGAPVTIRTLDLGADKQVDSGRSESPLPNNPALGLRAIRLCLNDYELFHTQLRAILRASAYGRVRIMIPMISNLQELKQAQCHIKTIKDELRRKKIRYARRIPVGAMIEVPAAAIAAESFARHCDFLSIGTNDLIQYTLAIDRVDDSVNYLYDPMHPAVLQLIRMTIAAGKKVGVPVSMCGEMAGDTRFTRLLLGLGLTDFSMHPASLLEIKEIINRTQAEDLKKLTKKILRADDTIQSHEHLQRMNAL